MEITCFSLYGAATAFCTDPEIRIELVGHKDEYLYIILVPGKAPSLFHNPPRGYPYIEKALCNLGEHLEKLGRVTILENGKEIKSFPDLMAFCKEVDYRK